MRQWHFRSQGPGNRCVRGKGKGSCQFAGLCNRALPAVSQILLPYMPVWEGGESTSIQKVLTWLSAHGKTELYILICSPCRKLPLSMAAYVGWWDVIGAASPAFFKNWRTCALQRFVSLCIAWVWYGVLEIFLKASTASASWWKLKYAPINICKITVQ